MILQLVLLGELTLIVAAASIDVVIAISLFGVFFGLAFSEGKHMHSTLLHKPQAKSRGSKLICMKCKDTPRPLVQVHVHVYTISSILMNVK